VGKSEDLSNLGATSAWQEREITLDLADSVNLASKNRLERILGQITHGNPSSLPSALTLHGGSAIGQQQGAERVGQTQGRADVLANPFACGLAHFLKSHYLEFVLANILGG
jgi:hypothetical protein